ncbi:hypothetical protein [Alkalihalobacillus sp. CinArs1]|uniref:hypothetical protein n=1 Tax=Alkalihalobacillus sp. CinArs1 TaxID=2995314 RepID=UPI0022DE710A|nr:hypothetical protein [Alkalihalobacillus sp. CinArs1]
MELWMIVLMIPVFILVLMGFNFLMGYRKDHIQIDFDERYTDFNEYVKAITNKLKAEGRKVEYTDYRTFKIDGKEYVFIERNVSIGGVPLQRTILKPAR